MPLPKRTIAGNGSNQNVRDYDPFVTTPAVLRPCAWGATLRCKHACHTQCVRPGRWAQPRPGERPRDARHGRRDGHSVWLGQVLSGLISGILQLLPLVIVFRNFKLPSYLQKRVLTYGLWGAAVARFVMIVAGVEAIQAFEPLLLVFAGILLFSAYKILTDQEEEADDDESLEQNEIVSFARKLYSFTPTYEGERFFSAEATVDASAKDTPWAARTLARAVAPFREDKPLPAATPLLLVLLVIEFSDIVFAVDSIPAVFGVTRDPFIVYTSNMFAITCLRSLFQLVSEGLDDLKYLQTSIAAVLGFVGLKMVVEFFGFEVDTSASLAVIGGALAIGIGASYAAKPSDS